MSELLLQLNSGQITALGIVLGTALVLGGVALGCVGMTQSYLARKQRISAELVSQMLATGHSISDIERALELAGLYERSATKEFVRDLGASIKARAGVSPA